MPVYLTAQSETKGTTAETLVAEAEAEDGTLLGVSVSTGTPGYSGTGYVTGFDDDTDMVTVSVDIPSEDAYRVVIRYNSPSGEKTQFVLVNGASSTPVLFPNEVSYASVDAGIYLFNTGSNTISVKKSWGYMDVDKFEVYTVEEKVFDIVPSLVDAQASIETAELYEFLKNQFGKRIISGQTTTQFEEVKTLTGVTPMLRNGDLSNYTEGYPYKWDNGHVFGVVDDGRVEEMISWYNASGSKGIVAYQWHWHSPTGGEPGQNNFYTENTTFDIRKAVVPGNQEYDDIIRDIDAIAVQLQKFEAANVPVVWRPLHEAGGGWFWWGAHGPEPCVALYNIIYDRLMSHHGIHNLIWVWSTPEPDWYPGNDKVDIVGHDSYPGDYNYSAQKYHFDNMFDLCDGKKLVAMTENGPIPDPAECFTSDAPWLWYMSWADLVFEQNSNEHIQQVFSDPTVITLESDNAVVGGPWRSSLYPEDWYPGYSDQHGRFLHDFSYAGYHQGEDEVPVIAENIMDITQSPYNADNSGAADVTTIIQQALDDVGAAGGGVVYLPRGTYQIKQSSTTSNPDAALHMKYDNTVLRGAGPDSTFLFHNEHYLRGKDIIHVRKAWSNWFESNGNKTDIAMDLLKPTKIIPMESVSGFSVGDLVVLRSRATVAFIEEHGMAGIWTESAIKGVAFLRKIDSIDVQRKFLIVDAPTRYALKTRDFASVSLANEHIAECGIENLSIGNLENPKTGWDEESHITTGTGAYDVHGSHMIQFKYAQDCWVSKVHTYKPDVNSQDIHVLSNMLLMYMCRNITVDSCDFQKPQYEGGGGNGYMYTFSGNNCLVKNSRANHSRHNFDFKTPSSNGNVILNCRGEHSKYSSDFHMYLSMSNLIDGFTVNEDYLESTFRPYGGTAIHGYSSTQSVFYNTRGEAYHSNKGYIIESKQFGWGYIIGTSGAADQVKLDPVIGTLGGYAYNTSPRDYAEGIGRGEDLVPQSLYLDQFDRRISNPKPHLQLFDVTILVRDKETGEVLADCEVAILDSTATTDLLGSATITGVPEIFILSVDKENYSSPGEMQFIIYSDTTLLVELMEYYHTVTMTVIDNTDQEPFPGVDVTIDGSTVVSDSEGKSRFYLHAGDYDYSVVKENYQSLSGSISIDSDVEHSYNMVRTHASVKFRVREDGNPVYQAYVKIGTDSMETSSIGVAVFEQVAVPASYEYTVRKDDFHVLRGNVDLTVDTTINLTLISDTVGISSWVVGLSKIRIWPNPAREELFVGFEDVQEERLLRIYDARGYMIEELITDEQEVRISLQEYPAGMYILQVVSGEASGRQLILKH